MRDNDICKLRQLWQAKNALIPKPCSSVEVERIYRSTEYRTLQLEFDRLFTTYGYNPEIFKDNERAGSKRDSTRKIKSVLKRGEKRSVKQRLRGEIVPPPSRENDA